MINERFDYDFMPPKKREKVFEGLIKSIAQRVLDGNLDDKQYFLDSLAKGNYFTAIKEGK